MGGSNNSEQGFEARHAKPSRPFRPLLRTHSRPWDAHPRIPFAAHSMAWNNAQRRLQASLGAPLRQQVREEAQKYAQQLPRMRARWQHVARMVEPAEHVRGVPEGMSDSTIQIGPTPDILFPRFLKRHFHMVGLACGHRPVKVGLVTSMECPMHGFYSYVRFPNPAHVDITLGLDSDEEEENCALRHEIRRVMVPVTRARDTASGIQYCCNKATRALSLKAIRAGSDKAEELQRNPSVDGESMSSSLEDGESAQKVDETD